MEINQQNIETWCLLYVDNALTSDEKMAVDTFIANNSQYESLLTSYQQTIIPIETHIQYEDKALLYRFEALEAQLDPTFKNKLYKKESSIIVMPLWAKWTASVAALFFLILGTQMLFLHTPSTQLADKQMILQNITSSFHLNDVQSKKSIEKSLSTTRIKKVEPIENANKQIVKSTELISPSNETFTTPTLNDESLNVASITNNNRFPTTTTAIEVTPNGISEKGKENNTNIAHEEMVFEKIEEEDEHVIYVGSLEINSDKLRGISRKFNALLKKVRTTEKEKEQ